MKLHKEYGNVERVGVSDENSFQIKTTAKAFDILSSGLYSDPILAVIRELSTNAYDAHIAAGKTEVPFDVHLPNELEPWFSVKDYGIGLSHEDVMHLYSTYFESTKTESNDFVGALGLGSKSPFSYSRSFIVISRFDNTRRTYSVFIDESGVPTIALMGEVATTECNGLEIKINVKSEDFRTFRGKAVPALLWFKPQPNILGNVDFNIPSVEPTLSGSNWRLYKGEQYQALERAGAIPSKSCFIGVQGCVGYNINRDLVDFNKEKYGNRFSMFERSYRNGGCLNSHSLLVLDFDIGDLDVAANREEIRYESRTNNNILSALDTFLSEFCNEIEKQISALSVWDACAYLYNTFNIRYLGEFETFKNYVNNNQHPKLFEVFSQNGHVSLPTADEMAGYQVINYTDVGLKRLRRAEIHPTDSFVPTVRDAVFVDDVKHGTAGRIQQWMRENNKSVYLIRLKDSKLLTKLVYNPDGSVKKDELGKTITEPLTEADIKNNFNNIIRSIGNPAVRRVSNTTPIKREERGNTRWKGLAVYDWNDSRRSKVPGMPVWERFSDSELDFSKGGLYLEIYNKKDVIAKHNNRKYNIRLYGFENIVDSIIQVAKVYRPKLVQSHIHNHSNVIGVSAKSVSNFENSSKWVNVIDLFIDMLPCFKLMFEQQAKFDATFDRYDDDYQCVGRWITYNPSIVSQVINNLDPKSDFRREIEPALDLVRSNKFHKTTVAGIHRLMVKLEIPEFKINEQSIVDFSKLDKYEMLLYLLKSKCETASRVDYIVRYIELIDRSEI